MEFMLLLGLTKLLTVFTQIKMSDYFLKMSAFADIYSPF